MNREAQVVEEVKRHICLDETAQIVNGKWVCGCPGGPYPSPYRNQQPAADDLMCPHSAAGRPERFPAKACILAGECGCVYGAEWSRALRLADDAALAAQQPGGSDNGR